VRERSSASWSRKATSWGGGGEVEGGEVEGNKCVCVCGEGGDEHT
jgi:hypothetical protein